MNKTLNLKDGRVLTVRKSISSDAAEMVAYLNAVGGESDNLLFGRGEFPLTAAEEEAFIERVNSTAASASFVGIVDGVIVSICNASSPSRKRVAHQTDVALSVRREYWGIGIGAAMLGALIDFARSNGVTRIVHLGVRADNYPAIHLYRKMGFEEIGLYKNFFCIDNVYYDEILMNLYL